MRAQRINPSLKKGEEKKKKKEMTEQTSIPEISA